MALTQTFQIGLIGLVAVMLIQLVCSMFGLFTPTALDLVISGFGVILFTASAVVDFYILPRSYRDDQHLAAVS